MCNLNAIFSAKEDKSLLPLINAMTWYSFKSNSDGDGALWKREGVLFLKKSSEKLIYNEPFEWIITHQRYATSGKRDDSMAHPYETKRIILFHNGVFNGLGNTDVSDTFEFTKILNEKLKKVRSERGVVKAVSNAINEATKNGLYSANYSIFFYHKQFDKVYYFRKDRPLYYVVVGDAAIFSTDKDNIEYALKYFGVENVEILQPKEKVLYEVSCNGLKRIGKLNIKEVSREKRNCVIGHNYYYHYGDYAWDTMQREVEQRALSERAINRALNELVYYIRVNEIKTLNELEEVVLEFFTREELLNDERILDKLLERIDYEEENDLFHVVLDLWSKYNKMRKLDKGREVVYDV